MKQLFIITTMLIFIKAAEGQDLTHKRASFALTSSGQCVGSILSIPNAEDATQINWYRNGTLVQTVNGSGSSFNVTVVAGGNGAGSDLNQLFGPTGVFTDIDGNIFVVDRYNNRVVKWAPGATSGIIVAGGNNGGAALDQLNTPIAVQVDAGGNIFVSEYGNNRVTKWAPGASGGVIVAGGNGDGSVLNQLSGPHTIFVNDAGDIYVSDQGNSRVVKWSAGASSGVIVAGGNGYGSNLSQLSSPQGIYLDNLQRVYVADIENNRIVRWDPGASAGVIVAGGNGYGSDLNQLARPIPVFVDDVYDVYVGDYANSRVVKWAPNAATGSIIAGAGVGTALNGPVGIWLDNNMNLYVVEEFNNSVVKFSSAIVSTYTTTAPGNYTAEVTYKSGCTIKSANSIHIIDNTTYYRDADGDGFGDATNTTTECSSTPPTGYVSNKDDCDDNDKTVYPNAPEVCDGKDNDCDGTVDEGVIITHHRDAVRISIADVSIAEGNNDPKCMNFIVSLNKPATKKITISYRTKNGTAVAGSDYAATSGTISFKPGVTQKHIQVLINGDKQVEPNETFIVQLSNPVNVVIADGVATGTILNNDGSLLTTQSEIITHNNKTQKQNYSVKIWPNPASDHVTVQLTGIPEGNVTFQLQPMQGRVLKQEKIKSFAKTAQQQIDVSGLANGVYLLVIVSDTGIRHTEKIVVVH